MFGHKSLMDEIDGLMGLIAAQREDIRDLQDRFQCVEKEQVVTERLRSTVHCGCGRFVAAQKWDIHYGYVWWWYDMGRGEPKRMTTCPDCITLCGPDDCTEQLQRKGKAK